MLCHAVTWYLSSELWVTWFPLELNGDPKPPKRQPLIDVQLFLVRPEPMVNGGRVERQKITNILIDNIKFRQELTKETHLLGSGQGTALKAGRLTWKRKAEAPKGHFDRWMMAFLLPLFLSWFLFVLIFESFGRWRQAHWQNRWMVVNGSVAEGRSSVADRCVVIGQWRSSHWKVSVTITIVSKSRHGLKPSWPWSIGQIWPTPVLGLDIGQLKCAMFIVNVKWEIWNWCSVMHFFASTINSRTTYKDQ